MFPWRQNQIEFDSLLQIFYRILNKREMLQELLNYQQKRDERPNLKIKYKNQRLEQAREIYLCECQKNYLSFPALYLHVKNKHKIKLTTKITDKICKMEEKNGKTYITYFLRSQDEIQTKKTDQNNSEQAKKSSKNEGIRTYYGEEQQKNPFKNEKDDLDQSFEIQQKILKNELRSIESLIFQYLKECSSWNPHANECSKRILLNFLSYIEKCCKISKQFDQIKRHQPQMLISKLPLFFNEFICFYLPQIHSSQNHERIALSTQIQIMNFFGNWLRQEKITNLFLLKMI